MLRTVFNYLVLIPILCFSSVILVLHEFMPSFYRCCIKPAVSILREDRIDSHVYVNGSSSVKVRSSMPLVSAFNKELDAIIKLIKLVSDGIGVYMWGGERTITGFTEGCPSFGNKPKRTPFLR